MGEAGAGQVDARLPVEGAARESGGSKMPQNHEQVGAPKCTTPKSSGMGWGGALVAVSSLLFELWHHLAQEAPASCSAACLLPLLAAASYCSVPKAVLRAPRMLRRCCWTPRPTRPATPSTSPRSRPTSSASPSVSGGFHSISIFHSFSPVSICVREGWEGQRGGGRRIKREMESQRGGERWGRGGGGHPLSHYWKWGFSDGNARQPRA